MAAKNNSECKCFSQVESILKFVKTVNLSTNLNLELLSPRACKRPLICALKNSRTSRFIQVY